MPALVVKIERNLRDRHKDGRVQPAIRVCDLIGVRPLREIKDKNILPFAILTY